MKGFFLLLLNIIILDNNNILSYFLKKLYHPSLIFDPESEKESLS